jgi:hypothetical protein
MTGIIGRKKAQKAQKGKSILSFSASLRQLPHQLLFQIADNLADVGVH